MTGETICIAWKHVPFDSNVSITLFQEHCYFAGSALVKCGQTEQKLGIAERELIQAAANNYIQPLRAFLDGDMKTVQVCLYMVCVSCQSICNIVHLNFLS